MNEIRVDLSKLQRGMSYYSDERIKAIAGTLEEAGQSIMGKSSDAGSQTLAAFTEGNQTPVRKMHSENGDIDLAAGVLIIGRAQESDIRIDNDMQVSRRHASLTVHKSDGSMTLRDLQSGNGTYVNGQRILMKKLAPGDKITVGETVLVLPPQLT